MSGAPALLRLENRHTGEILEFRKFRENGAVVMELRGSLPPHQDGPPLHIHHLEDEVGTVIAGTLTAEVGGRRVQATAGGSVQLPRGVPHRWWNEHDAPLSFAGSVRPAVDLDRYLQGVFEVMNAGPPGRPPLFYMAHVALRHRRTQAVLLLPAPIQGLLFRVVLAVGTLLGRYRGTDWPGAPERCLGVADPEDR